MEALLTLPAAIGGNLSNKRCSPISDLQSWPLIERNHEVCSQIFNLSIPLASAKAKVVGTGPADKQLFRSLVIVAAFTYMMQKAPGARQP